MTEQRHARDGAPRHRVLLIVGICVLVVALAVGIVVGVSALPTRRGHAAAGGSATRATSPSLGPATKSSPPTTADAASSAPPLTSPPATPDLGGLVVSPGDPQAATKTAVAKAYMQFRSVWDDLMITRSIDFTPLGDVADGDLLTTIEDTILTDLYGKNHLQKGRSIISDLKVTSISADGQIATLTACDDQSHVSIVDAKTGAVVSGASAFRVVDSVTMRLRDGRWKATGFTHPANC